jgi:hypothetical protein
MYHLNISPTRQGDYPDSKYLVVFLLVTWLLVLTSCTMLPMGSPSVKQASTESQLVKQAATASQKTLPMPDRDEIQRLLIEAEIAFSDDNLTTPVDDNAWYRYLRVLVLDPENQSAREGISDIIEKYLDWTIQDIEAGYLRKAREYLVTVRAMDDTHPNLASVEKRLAEEESTGQQTIKLSRYGLDNQSTTLADQLYWLGFQIQEQNARVIILARNDAEGRWIYQQLNKAEHGPRIRAQVKLDPTPSLRILTLR